MRDAFTLVERYFGGGNLNLLVDLDRITVDYLAVDVACYFNSEGAFTGGSGADDGDDWILAIHRRESITAQMRASSTRDPTSWLREKDIGQDEQDFFRINKISRFVGLS